MGYVLGVDPGSEQSGGVIWRDGYLKEHIIEPNNVFREWVLENVWEVDMMAIETSKPYPMVTAGGRAYMPEQYAETHRFIGRLQDVWYHTRRYLPKLVDRKEVLSHLDANKRSGSKDSQVVKALTNRYGKKGTKAEPGILYGIKSHEWQALAVAVTYLDQLPVAKF